MKRVERDIRDCLALLVVNADTHSFVTQVRDGVEHLSRDTATKRLQVGPIDPDFRARRFERREVGEVIGEAFHCIETRQRTSCSEAKNDSYMSFT
jgi:hypothetical protein